MSRRVSNKGPSIGHLTIGTRNSTLALIQTQEVIEALHALYPTLSITILPIKTMGDANKNLDITATGTGVFVQEIESALLDGTIDIAIHSLKDLPTKTPPGLLIGAIPQRLDPRDVIVSQGGISFDLLPSGSRIGTSSPRRTAQIKSLRKDLEVLPIRGNIDTRIYKTLEEQTYDACILASAGLIRSGLEDKIANYFSAEKFIPAPGQGALAIELRDQDTQLLSILSALDHPPSRRCITAERAFLTSIDGGCNMPVGAHAKISADLMTLSVFIGNIDGTDHITQKVSGNSSNPHHLALEAYQRVIERGGRTLLSNIRGLEK